MEDQPAVPMARKRLLLDLLGKWYWLVLAVILGLAGSFYYLSKAPRMYSASASLLVKEQTVAVMGKDQADEINMGSGAAMSTVVERLRRRAFFERVAAREEVRELHGIVPPRVRWLPKFLSDWLGDHEVEEAPAAASQLPPKALGGMIGSWTAVEVRRTTRLIDIRVTHPSPEVAAVLADAIALEYVAETTGDRSSGRTSTIELLAEQSELSRVALQESQQALSSYQRALSAHEELDAKEREVVELKRRYRDRHPEMISALAQLEGLKMRFLADFNAVVSSGADAAYWAGGQGVLVEAADDLVERLDTARRMLLSRTAVLMSEIKSLESVFNAMLTKMQQVEVNQAEQESTLEIHSLASLPGEPVSPDRNKVLMIGLLFGLCGGAGIAYGAVSLDNKFYTVMQVEELTGAPVLAAVSLIAKEPAARKGVEKLLGQRELEAQKFEKNWDDRIIFRESQSDSIQMEMYRVLRASITLLGPESERKVTLFTSAIPGEGKSTTAVNYSLAAAAQRKRVLLIDLDLRRPSVHLAFGLSSEMNQKGVTGYLAGQDSFEDSITRGINGDGIDVMFSGKMAPRPGELLNGALLSSLLAEAKAAYDVVVLDTAPLLAVPDTRVIAPYADNLCLVIRAEYVPKGACYRVLRLLESGRTPLSGIVFNGYRERRSMIGYNYTYGYYQYGAKGKAYGYGKEAYGYGSENRRSGVQGNNRTAAKSEDAEVKSA